jgi:hypothetical protein
MTPLSQKRYLPMQPYLLSWDLEGLGQYSSAIVRFGLVEKMSLGNIYFQILLVGEWRGSIPLDQEASLNFRAVVLLLKMLFFVLTFLYLV